MGGGHATAGGIEYQGRTAAYVAAHILARRRLKWIPRLPLVPTAISAETEGAGDDITLETAGQIQTLEVQVKKTLSRDRRFIETIERFCAHLPEESTTHGAIVVSSDSSIPIRRELREDLDLLRQGALRSPRQAFVQAQEIAEQQGTRAVLERLHVVELDVLLDESAVTEVAVSLVREVVSSRDLADAAWAALKADGTKLARERGRRDGKDIEAVLADVGIAVRPRGGDVSHVTDALRGGISTVDTTQISSSHAVQVLPEEKHAGQIQVARDLLESGETSAARRVLERLSAHAEFGDLDDGDQAATASLLGVSWSREGHLDEAAEYLTKALVHDPDYTPALVNLAAVEVNRDNLRAGVDLANRVLALDPHNVHAIGLLLPLSGQFEEAKITIPATLEKAPAILTAQARVRLNEGDLRGAVDLLQDVVGIAPEDIEPNWLLANTIVGGCTSGDLPYGFLPIADRAASKALELGEALGIVPLIRDALLARAEARRMRGESEGARRDLREACNRFPNSEKARLLLASMLLEVGEPEFALATLGSPAPFGPATGEVNVEALTLRVSILSLLRRRAEARATLDKLLEAVEMSDEPERSNLLIMVAEAAVNSGFPDTAETVLDDLVDVADHWFVPLLRARLAEGRGDSSEAERQFAATLELSHGSQRSRARGLFGDYLRRQGRLREAIDAYETAITADPASEFAETYARTLYMLGDLTKATLFLESLATQEPSLKWALELESRIAAERGDLQGTISTLTQLLELAPSDIDARIRLAMAHLRQDASPECEQQLQHLASLEDQATPSQLVQIAQLFAHIERYDAALQSAYRAARRAPQEKFITQMYIAIFSQCERSGIDLDADRVTAGTWVKLESLTGDELHYTIIDPLLEEPQPDEFTPDSMAVQDVINLHAGDTVVRQEGTEQETEFTIREIKTLYVHIFQDLLINYHRRHPDSFAIQGFRLPEKTVVPSEDPLLRSVMERRQLAEAVLDIYRRHDHHLV